MKKLGSHLKSNLNYKVGEILLIMTIGLIYILFVIPLAKDPIVKQLLVWLGNIILLLFIWQDIKLRNESWSDIGLSFKFPSYSEAIGSFLKSILIFLIAMTGFIIGSIIVANVTGIPQPNDTSAYNYLINNKGLLIISMIGVYIASSFGEEVIYRGFLLNRVLEICNNSKPIAIIFSSLVFGLIHYAWGPMGIVQTTLMGLGLSICYFKFRRRLWMLILAHAYMDTILIMNIALNT